MYVFIFTEKRKIYTSYMFELLSMPGRPITQTVPQPPLVIFAPNNVAVSGLAFCFILLTNATSLLVP